jgi:hypothetical protein
MRTNGTHRVHLWLLLTVLALAPFAVPAHSLAQTRATVKVMPQSVRLPINRTATLDLTIDQVSRLYGAQLRLTFDPDVLEVVDAKPEQQGIQIELGAMPIPDLVVVNAVDNQAGTIDYAVTQLPPHKPGEGNGIIASLTVRAKKAATTEIVIEQLLLSDTDGRSINVEGKHGQIKVVNDLLWVALVAGVVLLLGLVVGFGFVATRSK